jgi:hypothetical protein
MHKNNMKSCKEIAFQLYIKCYSVFRVEKLFLKKPKKGLAQKSFHQKQNLITQRQNMDCLAQAIKVSRNFPARVDQREIFKTWILLKIFANICRAHLTLVNFFQLCSFFTL